jgi:hypothetical protein
MNQACAVWTANQGETSRETRNKREEGRTQSILNSHLRTCTAHQTYIKTIRSDQSLLHTGSSHQDRMPDMSHSQLSIWQQEYALDHDDVQQATFDVDIPVIADVQDWTGWAWIRSRSVSSHRQTTRYSPDSGCYSIVQHG